MLVFIIILSHLTPPPSIPLPIIFQFRKSFNNEVSVKQLAFTARHYCKIISCLWPFPLFRAGDITELKILEIPGPGDNGQCGDFKQIDLGIPGIGCPGGTNLNGTGKLLKKSGSSTSAPQNIPRRTDVKSQDVAISPQQHQCSKSYMDRHMESLNQSKGFRRRHNSCEYVGPAASFLFCVFCPDKCVLLA